MFVMSSLARHTFISLKRSSYIVTVWLSFGVPFVCLCNRIIYLQKQQIATCRVEWHEVHGVNVCVCMLARLMVQGVL